MTESPQHHVDEQRLWSIASGERDPEAQRHVETCPDCQHDLETLRHLVRFRATTGGAMQEPPATLQTRMASLFGEIRPDLAGGGPSVADRIRDAVRRISAELILDSAATPQLAGLRSGEERRTRQLAFVSDVADLDLEVTGDDGGYSIAGQIGMDSVPAGLVIRFTPTDRDEDGVIEAGVLENGHFTVAIPAGEWGASVQMDDVVLQFPGIRL